ncbi:MAG: hypothetical protein C0501_19155 [Isosphaera sp.]|nr:hypothetical protein [Isosphaera sp.]
MSPVVLVLLAASLLPDPASKPRLVAKGDAFLVHVVPPAPSGKKGHPGRSMLVTHTRRDTGEMTVLAEGGEAPLFVVPDAMLMRESWDTRTIDGVRADGERVYVLTVHSQGSSTPAMGAIGTTTAELRVFWLADGSRVGTFPVEGVERGARWVWPSLQRGLELPDDAGPLKADLGGVSVLGQVFRFKGKERVPAAPDAPTDGTHPVFLASLDGFAIHAVRSPPVPAALKPTPGASPGTTILHVRFQAAHSRVLLQSGDREHKPEKGAAAPKVTQTRIVGTGLDLERLYVLVWHGEWQLAGPGEFVGPVLHPSDDYRLYTFRLADGADLPVVKVPGGKKEVPPESVQRGAVEPVPGGVKVFGELVPLPGKDGKK